MLIALILFLIAISTILVMLIHRAGEIDRGEVEPPLSVIDIPPFFSYERFAEMEDYMIQSLKRGLHKSAVVCMQTWVVASHFIDKHIHKRFPHVHKILFRKKEVSTDIQKRTIITIIREYREKMRAFRKRLREQDGLLK